MEIYNIYRHTYTYIYLYTRFPQLSVLALIPKQTVNGGACVSGLLNQGDTYLKRDRKENVSFCNAAAIL